jgi:fructosamine-3-kinase
LSGLIDPGGLRYVEVEMELAYLEAFKTVRPEFFRVYSERRPLRPGYGYRRLFYWLDTFMTHIWLGFGPKYHKRLASACNDVLAMTR